MSYTILQEQGEESSAASFSDIPAYVLSKLNLTAGKSCCNDNETESFRDSRSGMTLKPLTEDLGEEKSMLSAGDSLVRTLVWEPIRQEAAKESMGNEADYGGKWHALYLKCNLNSYSLKTVHCLLIEDLHWSYVILPEWGMMQDGELFEPLNLASIIIERGCSFMPTIVKTQVLELESPMEAGNTRQGESGYVEKTNKTGKRGSANWYLWMLFNGLIPTPKAGEYFMGWPIGWTDCQELEMDKFQQWLNSHGRH